MTTPNDLAIAYQRSAYPALGIPLERALADPALRATLELAGGNRKLIARQTAAAGRYLERTAQ